MDLQRLEQQALRGAHAAGDDAAARRIAAAIRDARAAAPPAELTPAMIAQGQKALEGAAMDRAAGLGVQDVRNLAGDVLPTLTTAGGIALGTPGGIPGMVAGGLA